jgi:hypothetical protein
MPEERRFEAADGADRVGEARGRGHGDGSGRSEEGRRRKVGLGKGTKMKKGVAKGTGD